MQPDDLRTPLKPRSRLQRMWEARPSPSRMAAMTALMALIGMVTWAVLVPPPEGLDPVASAPVAPVDPVATASIGRPQAAPGKKTGKSKKAIPASDEFKVLPPPDSNIPDAASLPRGPEDALSRKEASLIRAHDKALVMAPVRAVSERTKLGLLPRVARNGRKPFDVYAKPVPKAILVSSKPKVAIVLGGLGVNETLTRRAVNELPGVVTLAYAPYGKTLQRQINDARRAGHEILLQLPMEPWAWPSVNPGPKTLLVSARPETNIENMKWLMGRATGYIGLVNYTGQRFLAAGEALAPILHEIKRRGLVFLDDGIAPRSLLTPLASVIGLPAMTATSRIDSNTEPAAIRAELDGLVEKARETGQAIGVGAAFAETIGVVEEWLKENSSGEEFVIVPLSTLYKLRGRG